MKTKNKVILNRQKTINRRKTVLTMKTHWFLISQLLVLFAIGVVIGRWLAIVFLTQ